jgi:hypothetical protein
MLRILVSWLEDLDVMKRMKVLLFARNISECNLGKINLYEGVFFNINKTHRMDLFPDRGNPHKILLDTAIHFIE